MIGEVNAVESCGDRRNLKSQIATSNLISSF